MSTTTRFGFNSDREIEYFVDMLTRRYDFEDCTENKSGGFHLGFDKFWVSIEKITDDNSWNYHTMEELYEPNLDIFYDYKMFIIYYQSIAVDFNDFIDIIDDFLNTSTGDFVMWSADDGCEYLLRHNKIYINKKYFQPILNELCFHFEVIPPLCKDKKHKEKTIHTIELNDFSLKCLAFIEQLSKTGESITLTKQGKPIVQISPVIEEQTVL